MAINVALPHKRKTITSNGYTLELTLRHKEVAENLLKALGHILAEPLEHLNLPDALSLPMPSAASRRNHR